MNVPIALATIVLFAVVIVIVSAPLRAAKRLDAGGSPKRGDDDGEGGSFAVRTELETARDAKYREIRDAELDFRTGKLSREDYDAVDRALRAEAIEILNRLEGSEDERDAAARGS